jgi:hypothetical protein
MVGVFSVHPGRRRMSPIAASRMRPTGDTGGLMGEILSVGGYVWAGGQLYDTRGEKSTPDTCEPERSFRAAIQLILRLIFPKFNHGPGSVEMISALRRLIPLRRKALEHPTASQ